MFLVIATLLAGLGLFFVGLKLLTENLKLLSGRRLRENISVWTRNPFFGLAWGGLFITITQSAAAATFIIIGMLRAGMLNVKQILPILIGMNCFAGRWKSCSVRPTRNGPPHRSRSPRRT